MSLQKQKILIVDDEQDIRDLLEYYLLKEGYLVSTASDGKEGIAEALRFGPNLIIMDIMMPKMDGIEAGGIIRNMNAFNNTFLVYLSARSEEYSEIAAFNLGADDYISKPLKPKALVTRIGTILKRNNFQVDHSVSKLQISDLLIDRESYLVYQKDSEIAFPKKEFELLYLLASKPGKVFSREAILRSIWDNAVVVTNRTIDVHIRKVREKLGEGYISTIKGVGYKFEV